MSTTLLVVRHGQTDWNTADRFRGRTDLELNEVGLRQAQLVARRIAAEYQPSAIYSSPLRRSLQTAGAIGSHCGLEPEADDGLLDLDYGEFAGLSRDEAAARYPDLYRTWTQAPHAVRFPKGESLEVVRARVAELAVRLAARYDARQVVLVSHVVVIRTLLCSLLGLPTGRIESFRIDPCSLTVVETRGARAELIMTNSSYHLAMPEPAAVQEQRER